MGRVTRLGALLLAAVAGCTAVGAPGAGSSTSAAAGAGSVSPTQADTEVGNARPQVTHDGLMVRRRVVLAILPTPGTDVVALRRELDRVATARHTTLTDISPSVLDPAEQEELAPDLTVALPAGATRAEAEDLVDPAGRPGVALPGVEDYAVAPVLVHDLLFTARAENPSALAVSLAREGILADALGSYSTSSGSDSLEVTYTGPLLSDDLVEAVRRGIARGAGPQASSVTVAPRSLSGEGVDLTREPAPAPRPSVEVAAPAHGHGTTHAATAREADPPSRSNLWAGGGAVVALAAAVGLGITLVRSGDEEQDAEVIPVVTS